MEGIEDSDTDNEVFKRRMGLRHYFKELKMNMQRISKSKDSKKGGKEEKKVKSSPEKKTKTPKIKVNGVLPMNKVNKATKKVVKK